MKKTLPWQGDGDNILAEYNANNTLLARYTHSPMRADDILSANFTSDAVSEGLSPSQGNTYYLKDLLGSITDIVTASGSLVQRYEYSSFGKIISVKSGSGAEVGLANAPIRTSFAYTGREWDDDAGVYYYRARYYDPGIGRFLQQDPHPGKTSIPITVVNRYAYAGNSPTIFTDPSGEIFGIDDYIIAAIIGGVVGAIDASRVSNNLLDILSGAMVGALTGAVLMITAEIAPASNLLGLLKVESASAGIALAIGPTVISAASKGGSFIQNLKQGVLRGETIVGATLSWMGATGRSLLSAEYSAALGGTEKIATGIMYAATYLMEYTPSINSYCAGDGGKRCK